jgi:uncharacterized membrane protein YphA (DoxX/SURF4 family)
VPYLELSARCLIGAVFLVASVSKVAGRNAFGSFLASLRDMRPLPPGLVPLLARLVIAVEFTVWVLLAIPSPLAAEAGFVLAALSLAGFTAAIAIGIRRGDQVPCRCFGTSATPLRTRHLVRNVLLVAVAVLGALATSTSEPVDPAGAVAAVAGGLMLGGLVTAVDDIFELFRPTGLTTAGVPGRSRTTKGHGHAIPRGHHGVAGVALRGGPRAQSRRDQETSGAHGGVVLTDR